VAVQKMSTRRDGSCRIGRRRAGSWLVAGLCLLLSCRHASREDGEPVIRRATWWNFYNRGLARSLNGKWAAAAEDFLVAMGRKQGAVYGEEDEKRRAKTYGLHFLDDYFPHRELGV